MKGIIKSIIAERNGFTISVVAEGNTHMNHVYIGHTKVKNVDQFLSEGQEVTFKLKRKSDVIKTISSGSYAVNMR